MKKNKKNQEKNDISEKIPQNINFIENAENIKSFIKNKIVSSSSIFFNNKVYSVSIFNRKNVRAI